MNIPTIDGRVIPLPCNDVIKPGTVKRLRGEGLPFPKVPTQRGDLIVEFKVRFPDRLTPQTRQILKQHLPCSYEPPAMLQSPTYNCIKILSLTTKLRVTFSSSIRM